MGYQKIAVPVDGSKITVNADLSLNVPNNPIIPFIEGDGIGVDITPAMKVVVDAAVQKSLWWQTFNRMDGSLLRRKSRQNLWYLYAKKLLMHCVNLLFLLKAH